MQAKNILQARIAFVIIDIQLKIRADDDDGGEAVRMIFFLKYNLSFA